MAVRFKHSALGEKTISLFNPTAILTPDELNFNEVTTKIKSYYGFNGASKILISLPKKGTSDPITSSETLFDAIDTWTQSSSERLNLHVEKLSTWISTTLQAKDSSSITKAARTAWELAAHPTHQQHLMNGKLLKGLVAACGVSSFIASGTAAGAISQIIHHSNPELRAMVLDSGALFGLLKQLRNTNIPRASDELMRLHAISALCCELDRSCGAGINILTSMNEKSIPTLEVIRILALVCTTGTKDTVISGACAVLSRLLPHSTIAAINEIGTSLTYVDHRDCIKVGLWALCAVARSKNMTCILVPRKVVLQKEMNLHHTKQNLMNRLIHLGENMMLDQDEEDNKDKHDDEKKQLNDKRQEQIKFLSMAFWNLSSAIISEHSTNSNNGNDQLENNQDFNNQESTLTEILTDLACNPDVSVSKSASAALANMAASGTMQPTAILCVRLLKQIVSPNTSSAVTIGLSAAVAFLCRSRYVLKKNYQSNKDDVGQSNELFQLLIAALTQRVDNRFETPQQHFIAAAMMYVSLPQQEEDACIITNESPTRTVTVLQMLASLLQRWTLMDHAVKQSVCLSLWGLAQNTKNCQHFNELHLIEKITTLYMAERPGDAPDLMLQHTSNNETKKETNNSFQRKKTTKESSLQKEFRKMKETREHQDLLRKLTKDIGLAKTRQYLLGVVYLLTYNEMCREAFFESKTLAIIVDGLNDPSSKVSATSIGIIWKLCEYDNLAQLIVSKTKGVDYLLRIAVYGRGTFSTQSRIFALNALSILVFEHPKIYQEIRKLQSENESIWGGDMFYEKALIKMLKEDDLKLNTVAGVCTARLAMSPRQKKMGKVGAVSALFGVVKRGVFQSHQTPGSDGRCQVTEDQLLAVDGATLALRNLSVYKNHQIIIAKQGLRTLMQLGIAIADPSVSSNTKSILHNISKNPLNRTTIYKAQLKSDSAEHRCKAEMELRRVLTLKSKAKSMKRRILRTGAGNLNHSNSLKQAASLNETHWDLKRRREAGKSWLAVPQSASHLVGVEDRLLCKKQPQLSSLLMRPMSKMFNTNSTAIDDRERENLWEPKIVRYIYEDPRELLPNVDTTSARHTKPRTIPSSSSSSHICKSFSSTTTLERPATTIAAKSTAIIIKKSTDQRLSQSMRRAKLMRPSTAEMVLSPVRKRNTKGRRSNKRGQGYRSAPAKIKLKTLKKKTNKEQMNPPSKRRPGTAPTKGSHGEKNCGRGGTSFSIHLQPEHAHYNRLSFGKKNKPKFGPMLNAVVQQPGVSLYRWAYVEGNRISEGNYNYFEMPDGRLSHFYSRAELKQAILPPPTTLIPNPLTLSIVCPGFHHGVDEPLPQLPPPPKANKTDANAIASFVSTCQFPLNSPPTGSIKFEDTPILLHVTEIAPAVNKEAFTSVVVQKKWTLESSAFAPRKMKSDARAFYDNDRVKKKAFTIDWANLTSKKKFVSMILKTDDEGGEDEVKEVRAAVWKSYSVIMDAFEFYSVMGTSLTQAYTIQSNAFNDFVDDCKITDMATCKRKDIDTIFIVANLEDDKQSKTNKANDDRALMRFEFLECVVRIAIAKYLKSGATDDVSDAVTMLCERNLQTNLGMCRCDCADVTPPLALLFNIYY